MEAITKRAIEAAGGPKKVADAICETGKRISPQAVSQWKRVPDVYVRLLESLGGAVHSRYENRPDIFGEPEQVAAQEAANA